MKCDNVLSLEKNTTVAEEHLIAITSATKVVKERRDDVCIKSNHLEKYIKPSDVGCGSTSAI